MESLQTIFTSEAPAAIGPYSQAVIAGNLLFVSGQLPIDPSTGQFLPGGIAEHTHQCLKNIQAIAKAAGTRLGKAVKLNVYLADMKNFDAVNQVYAEYFADHLPARLALQVAKLPKDADIEIEAIISL